MANFLRMRVTWGGAPVVGAGLSTFYFSVGSTGMSAAVAQFFNDIKNQIPGGVTWGIPNNGDVIDAATGGLVGTWTDGSSSSVTSVVSATWVQGVGARIVWNTGGTVRGRRVRGSTFIVPILTEKFTSGGALDDSMVAQFTTAAEDLRETIDATGSMEIWSRPIPGDPGDISTVTSGQCLDKVSWLRSRRT